MKFTIECPACKKNFHVNYKEVAEKPSSLKCCTCGTTPSPDIMTAYQNVGRIMVDLYGCCDCDEKKEWLPKAVK